MIHNQFNLSRRTIVQTNKFKGDMVSILKSIHHWEKLEWLAETNETTTERGPGSLCLHSAVLNCFSNTLNLAGNLHKKTERGSAVVPVQMEQKLSEFLPVADGGRSERQMEKMASKMFTSLLEPERKKLDWRGNIPFATKSNRVLLRH